MWAHNKQMPVARNSSDSTKKASMRQCMTPTTSCVRMRKALSRLLTTTSTRQIQIATISWVTISRITNIRLQSTASAGKLLHKVAYSQSWFLRPSSSASMCGLKTEKLPLLQPMQTMWRNPSNKSYFRKWLCSWALNWWSSYVRTWKAPRFSTWSKMYYQLSSLPKHSTQRDAKTRNFLKSASTWKALFTNNQLQKNQRKNKPRVSLTRQRQWKLKSRS